MKIRHETVNINGVDKIYLYVEVADEYEFGEEFLKPSNNYSFLDKLKDYANKNIDIKKDDMAVLIINGVLIGAISLGILSSPTPQQLKNYTEGTSQASYTVTENYQDKQTDNTKELVKQTAQVEQAVPATPTVATPVSSTSTQTAPAAKVVTPPTVTTTTAAPKTATPAPAPAATSAPAAPAPKTTQVSGVTIKLSTNGQVQTMNLEDYVTGVVASEMSPTFSPEALKAQAVVARTFAMRKASQGLTLVNSTSDQTYKSPAQLQQLWGSSYTTYYNKIRSAVDATQGLVLKYNGQYIDAEYFTISNSKTESPKYVWGSSVPYLQTVSSNWDVNVKGFEVSTNVSYATMSSKLGQTITKDTPITVLSKTPSDRVDTIKIGDTTYTGVKVRSLLGLRSTDFTIVMGDTSATITTKGLGHGVGMSQYGANEAAKQGYTFSQILTHYYTGVQLVKI